MKYKIKHYETLMGVYYVEAETPAEAMEIFDQMGRDGKIGFSDLEMIDSNDVIG